MVKDITKMDRRKSHQSRSTKKAGRHNNRRKYMNRKDEIRKEINARKEAEANFEIDKARRDAELQRQAESRRLEIARRDDAIRRAIEARKAQEERERLEQEAVESSELSESEYTEEEDEAEVEYAQEPAQVDPRVEYYQQQVIAQRAQEPEPEPEPEPEELDVRELIISKSRGVSYNEFIGSLSKQELEYLMTPPLTVGEVLTTEETNTRYEVEEIHIGHAMLSKTNQIINGRYVEESHEFVRFNYTVSDVEADKLLKDDTVVDIDRNEESSDEDEDDDNEDDTGASAPDSSVETIILNRTQFSFSDSL